MSAQAPKVVLVGHCGFDASALARLVRTACPGAEISHANSDAELAKIDKTALFLVNRALDGAFSASDGVALIAAVRAQHATACMLISNYDDAQQRAIDAGAMLGFGKAGDKNEAIERIRAAMGMTQ